jgi:hypothetical protein
MCAFERRFALYMMYYIIISLLTQRNTTKIMKMGDYYVKIRIGYLPNRYQVYYVSASLLAAILGINKNKSQVVKIKLRGEQGKGAGITQWYSAGLRAG